MKNKNINFFIKKYLENRPMFFSLIRPQEALFFETNKKYIKGKVLDFGCGDGFFAELVFGKGKIDIGLDLEKNERVKEAIKNKVYKRIALYDGNKIPFPNNYFDTIISNCVLEHIPNLSQSIKEIYRVLKPGGYFLATVMTDNWEKFLLGKNIFGKKYLDFLRKKQEHYNLLTKKQWENIFKKQGFKIISSSPYLSKTQSKFLEFFHYLSFPSLVSYKLFKKWVIFPFWYQLFFFDRIIEIILNEKNYKKTAGLFFIFKK